MILENRALRKTVEQHQKRDAELRAKIAKVREQSRKAIESLEYAQRLAG